MVCIWPQTVVCFKLICSINCILVYWNSQFKLAAGDKGNEWWTIVFDLPQSFSQILPLLLSN